jgi:hypothetical protein
MAYATSAQIASESKIGLADFTTSTLPTLAKVEEIIAEVEAKMNAIVGRRYTTPVTGDDPLLIMRGISIALCTERVREIMAVKTGKPKEEQTPGGYSPAHARKDLERIALGELPLAGETKVDSTDGIRPTVAPCGHETVFKRGCDQW